MQSPPQKLTKELKHELLQFFQTHPPDVFSQRLRCLLLEYLSYELRTSIPLYLPEFLYSLYDLFNVLDTAAKDFNTLRTENNKKNKMKAQQKIIKNHPTTRL